MTSVEQRVPHTYMMDTESLCISLRNRLGRGWFYEATGPEARALEKALARFLAAHEVEDQRQAVEMFSQPVEAL